MPSQSYQYFKPWHAGCNTLSMTTKQREKVRVLKEWGGVIIFALAMLALVHVATKVSLWLN